MFLMRMWLRVRSNVEKGGNREFVWCCVCCGDERQSPDSVGDRAWWTRTLRIGCRLSFMTS